MQKIKTEDLSKTEVIEKTYYQWIKGDDSGLVITIKEEDDQWIYFNEGGRLSKDLKSEYIQELDSDIAGEFVETKPSGIDPLNVSVTPEIKNENANVPQIDTPSPIRVLFNKQKKNNKVKLLLEFPVNIPQKDVYKLMSTSFDKTEVNDVLQSFILDQLSEDEILSCLHNSVQSLIESKYKGE
tara:strand:+ start:1398 stop:1946 length:549 start_codon:yes stop_codon:yes gene_type:complete